MSDFQRGLDSVLISGVYNLSGGQEMKSLKIGQLAKKAQVNIETVKWMFPHATHCSVCGAIRKS